MRVRGLSLWGVLWLCVVSGALSFCGASALAAGGGSGLIDGRGWELVSPVDKHGAGIEPLGYGAIQAAEGGGAIAYVAGAPAVANPAGAGTPFSQILSRRGPDGWSSENIAPPYEVAPGYSAKFPADYFLLSSDLSVGLLYPQGDTPLPPLEAGAEETPYLRDSATGGYLPLVTAANVPLGTRIDGEGALVLEGLSPDLSHVVIFSAEALTRDAFTSSAGNLYEWAGGRLQLISVLPNGRPTSEEGVSVQFGWGSRQAQGVVRHAISDDGSRVVWETDPAPRKSHLYLRDTARGETVQLDVVRPGAEGSGTSEPHFQTASSDGSRVFFTDTQALTVDAKPEFNSSDGDLYVFEASAGGSLSSGTLRDLTVDGNVGESAGVQGVLPGASEDGSYVYFVANGALTSQATGGIYVEHNNGVEWEKPKLVTAGADPTSWAVGGVQVWKALAVRVSPNGRYLAFASDQGLTGYDNHDAVSGALDVEVYLYDAVTGHLACASCDPTGARPAGVYDYESKNIVDQPGTFTTRWLAGSIPAWMETGAQFMLYQSRFLSDGGRLFFDSPVGLVPGDVNGKEDVYEFEPVGVGGCQAGIRGVARVVYSAVAGGCVGLISSGTSDEESAFVEADATGGEVFFMTSAGLVSQDVDGAFDLYAARECTSGSPCLASSGVSSPSCPSPEACRGVLSSPGVFGSPGSATFAGAGNLAPPAAGVVKPAVRGLSRAQKLAKALKACRKKPRGKRRACKARALRAFGARSSRAVGATARSGR